MFRTSVSLLLATGILSLGVRGFQPLSLVGGHHHATVCRATPNNNIENTDNTSWNGAVERQIASTALVGLLTMAPMVAPAMAASQTATTTPAVAIPEPKKNLDTAKASLKAESAKLKVLKSDLDKAQSAYNKAAKTAAKDEQSIAKYLAAVDSETQKLNQVKKTGEKDPIKAEMAKLGKR